MDGKHTLDAASRSRTSYAGWVLVAAVITTFVYFLQSEHCHGIFEPSDPLQRAHYVMQRHPLIDTHVDLPIAVRAFYANQISNVSLDTTLKGQVDIPRLRKGKVGGFFWSVYVPCADDAGYEHGDGKDFLDPTYRVRDTIEQIDVSRLLINKYPETFTLSSKAEDITAIFRKKRLAAFLGVEGAHQLGNSLSSLRMYYELGVRYITLTHTCNNAFADSAGMQGKPIEEIHGGLSSFGRRLVEEMNRVGMLVDVSHTSVKTQHDALTFSQSPIIFSHSNTRAVLDVVRNVPVEVLERISGRNQSLESVRAGDALICVTFAPDFVSPAGEVVNAVKIADHIDSIASMTGKDHVCIGSDFDGIFTVPDDVKDVSEYPNLIAELFRRGWSSQEVRGILSNNLIRVMKKVETVATKLQMSGMPVINDIYSKRQDLPMRLPNL